MTPVLRLVAITFVLLRLPAIAHATSQWSRKYGVACTTCHTPAFPRLNYYGERFMRNGYQDLGTQDGDTAGKQKIGDRLFIDELGNFFGVRLNVVPLRVTTNALEDEPGEFTTRFQIGNADWLQFFTAGSVFENVSVFIETEVNAEGEIHNSWFRFGFHNLLGTKALNAWIGVLDPLELHAASGRLPMLPPARHETFFVRSSAGAGDDSVDLRGGRPAVAVFGSAGPFVYEVGVDNGSALQDPNTRKNLWATLRLETTGGAIEGSSISVWGYLGHDTKNVEDAMGNFTRQVENDFWRVSAAANLRGLHDLDVIVAWVFGRDDDVTLDPVAPADAELHGAFAQVGHPIGTCFYAVAQYDGIWSDDLPEQEVQKLAVSVSYLPRENWRLILMPRLDLLEESAAHPRRQHEVTLVIRSMF
jgi:hypothetical protein